jgi:uncharacterized protein (TIGR03545 family)
MKIFRWKAIVPMLLFLATVVVVWRLFANTAIRRSIEFVGTEIMGAKVELESARLRLLRADLVLTGLQVTDPFAPMRNLIEVAGMVADINALALLEKKAVIETLAVRGVRFGTPRRTSGALDRDSRSPATGIVVRRLDAWRRSLPRPTLDLTGIVGTVVNIPAIDAESLQTLRHARMVTVRADSMRAAWTSELQSVNHQPLLDSSRALLERLRATDARRLGARGVAQAGTDVRNLAAQIQQSRERLSRLQQNVSSGIGAARAGVAGLDSSRRADYAFARGLVNIPSFAAPDVSAALFGTMAEARLAPVLHWVNMADQYVPAGLRPRQDPAPPRARMDGTVYRFPAEHTWPQFLLEHADADLLIGGGGAASGSYAARLDGFTVEPAVYGRPTTFSAGRVSEAGPRDIRIGGMMDRIGRVPRDSLAVRVTGVAMPDVAIPAAQGASVSFGETVMEMALTRAGEQLDGFYRIRAPAAVWRRSTDSVVAAARPRLGSQEWAEQLLWRAMSAVTDVQIEIRFSGLLSGPSLSISSNVGTAVAAAVQREIGAEVERVERQVRAEVDRRINAATAEARQRVAALESEVQRRVGEVQQQLDQTRADLDQRVRELQSGAGVNLPGIPRPSLPRP